MANMNLRMIFKSKFKCDLNVIQPSCDDGIVPTCRHSQLEAHLQKQDEDLHKEVNDRIDGPLDEAPLERLEIATGAGSKVWNGITPISPRP